MYPSLSTSLFREVRPEFFRVLAGAKTGRLYVDALDVLERAAELRDGNLPAFRASLEPLRQALGTQDYLGGEEPSYADYTVFGSFQWARLTSSYEILAEDDTLLPWLDRMLDLFDGYARDAKGI